MKICTIKVIDPDGFFLSLSSSFPAHLPSWMKLCEQEFLHFPEPAINLQVCIIVMMALTSCFRASASHCQGSRGIIFLNAQLTRCKIERIFFSFLLRKIGHRWRWDSTDLSFEVKRKSFRGGRFVSEDQSHLFTVWGWGRNFWISTSVWQGIL